MRKRYILSFLLVLVGIVIQVWRKYRLWMYVPGLMMTLKNGPVAENEEMIWTNKNSSEKDVKEQRPNIILILVDDLGFNDISFYGKSRLNITTPNIDSLGRDGVSFTDAYAGHATCAPSRAALLTGRLSSTVGYEFTPTHPAYVKIIGTSDRALRKGIYHKEIAETVTTERMNLPHSEVTVAKALKENFNYSTLMLGKWHLGESNSPTTHGFDQFLGFNLLSMYMPANSNESVGYRLPDQMDELIWASARYQVSKNADKKYFSPKGYMTDYLANEANAAITANRHNPFFLFMSLSAPHTPFQSLKSDYDKLSHIEDELTRVYAAMIVAIDRAVGTVLQSLRDNNLSNNTIVIFTNDNGAPNWTMQPKINSPFRGWKGTFFEGGLRVPLLMKWPDVIAPDTVVSAPVSHVDIFPTLMNAANVNEGARVDYTNPLSGDNLLPYIRANSDIDEKALSERTFFWRSGHYKAIRRGKWKLQKAGNPDKIWLYDLSSDPSESNNLAGVEPFRSDVLPSLLSKLFEEDSKQRQPLWPSFTETALLIDKLFETNESLDDEFVYWPN